jgi:hypothetical protein
VMMISVGGWLFVDCGDSVVGCGIYLEARGGGILVARRVREVPVASRGWCRPCSERGFITGRLSLALCRCLEELFCSSNVSPRRRTVTQHAEKPLWVWFGVLRLLRSHSAIGSF